MIKEKYTITDDGIINDDENNIIPIDNAVSLLNQYHTGQELQEQLIQAYETKIHSMEHNLETATKTIKELQQINKEYETERICCDINYWKGIEKAQEKLLDQYLERIIRLEQENSLLLYEIVEETEEEEKNTQQ